MQPDFRHLLQMAVDYLTPVTDHPEPDFRLEQVELNRTTQDWEVVVSFLIKEPQQPSIIPGFKAYHPLWLRVFKKLLIDSNTLEIKGFYIYPDEKKGAN